MASPFPAGRWSSFGSNGINRSVTPIGRCRASRGRRQNPCADLSASRRTPVTGAYTRLGASERRFKPQGETLAFTGARPLDAQSESGHTIVISAYQFQVKAADVSPGLLELEPGEVPAEYRLFFDKPVLK